MNQIELDPTTPLNVIAIITATFVLSAITYRYVELPIRSRRWLPITKQLLGSVGVGFVFVASFGAHALITDGASYRYSQVARSYLTAPLGARTQRCGIVFRTLHPQGQVCALYADPNATKRILLWGNSHADHWSGLFSDLAHDYNAAFYLNARNCRATPDHDFCGKHVQKAIFDFIATERITDVVLASTGYGSYKVADSVFENNLKDVVQQLADIGVRTWLVIDVPVGKPLDPIVAYKKNPSAPQLGAIPLSEYLETKEREQDLFESISGISVNVHVIDPSLNLCDSENCLGGKDGVIWYRDSGHISDAGAEATRDQFEPIFMTKD
jgi:hypothetical protein